MANRGAVYTDIDGQKYIAYDKEQEIKFRLLGKVYVHWVDDKFHPIIENGKPKKGLKQSILLTIKGFVD